MMNKNLFALVCTILLLGSHVYSKSLHQVPLVDRTSLPVLSGAYRDVLILDENIYICASEWEGYLYTYRIDQADSLLLTDTQGVSYTEANKHLLTWNGNHLFTPHGGISAYDVAIPDSPTLIPHTNNLLDPELLPDLSASYGSYVYSLYLSLLEALSVVNLNTIDFADPANPIRTSIIETVGFTSLLLHDIEHPYLVANRTPFVFDIVNPSQPVPVPQIFSSSLDYFVPFGQYFVASMYEAPYYDRVLRLSADGELSFVDDGNDPDSLWFQGRHLDPKAGTTGGVLAGYDESSESILVYKAMGEDLPELVDEIVLSQEPLTISISDQWIVLTTADSMFLYSIYDVVAINESKFSTHAPEEFSLLNSYPNPFNPSTTIKYELAQDTSVRLSIYDLKGRLVRKLKSKAQSAGHQEAFWNGLDEHQSPVSSGIYLAQLSTPGFSQSIKLVYIK